MNKKKLLAVAAIVLVAFVASGVVAWLSDGDTAKNEITTGRVDIRLVEESWNPDTARNVRPNTVLPRDPRIQNVGLNDAFVFLTVEMAALPEGTLLHSGTGMARTSGATPLFTTQASSGTAFDNANWTLVTHSQKDGRITQVYAYAKNNAMTPLKRNAITTAVFDRVRLANVVDTASLTGLNPNIIITAYAIQSTQLGKNGSATAPLEVWNIVTKYQASKAE